MGLAGIIAILCGTKGKKSKPVTSFKKPQNITKEKAKEAKKYHQPEDEMTLLSLQRNPSVEKSRIPDDDTIRFVESIKAETSE
ncbi:unnamed protein product [Bursaphelenchus xylophilus]|uniref:(pine wood nematode) hypothetical protein n=1 Tax=Bursaphelenchus xylophilus TaxID=6326 RepID=A0A1I7S3B8_BURXY|nr:unnamed protein product [Bursaphelenchus xylophilus]CAG9116198.1 unnamed protein product [Bursaphelenchus xylophilus]